MPSREEILAMAKNCDFDIYANGDIRWRDYNCTDEITKFFHLAYAAGQRNMQERAVNEIVLLPILMRSDGYVLNQRETIGRCADALRNLEVK